MGSVLLSYDALLVDLDGVVWRGREIIQENARALREAQARGVKVVFLTNNSTRSRRLYARLLSQLGFSVGVDDVVTSGYAAVEWVRRRIPGALIYIVGEEGLAEEAGRAGLTLATRTDAISGKVDAVVVGLDRNLTYSKLNAAHTAISRGALFVAANTDRVIPVEGGSEAPGAGAIVAALEASLGRGPDFVAGKPSVWIARLASERAGGGRILVIGDRLDTDYGMARRAGMDCLIVLTGVTKREDLEALPPGERPEYVFRSLEEAL